VNENITKVSDLQNILFKRISTLALPKKEALLKLPNIKDSSRSGRSFQNLLS